MEEGPIAPPKIRRRTDIDIVALILGHLRRTPSRKQQLMNECGINNKTLTRYLNKLVKGGYVLELPLSSGRQGYFYTISPTGNQVTLELQESIDFVEILMA